MKKRISLKAVVGIVCVLLVAMGAMWFADYSGVQMQEQECDLLFDQVRRAAVDCYASEGRYPQTLDYLVEHYGLIYDEERYIVIYDAFASNIMPDIAVRVRGEEMP